MQFCTVINCMDGRVQVPVIQYLQKRFNAEYVDSITEPGPNLILSEQADAPLIQSILARLKISIENHGSVGLAIVGHHGCAGNPAPEDEQIQHIKNSISFLGELSDEIEVIGLWVNEDWLISEI